MNFDELGQIRRPKREKNKQTEEKVIKKDKTEIIQPQVGESTVLSNKFIQILVQSNFRATTRRSTCLLNAVHHLGIHAKLNLTQYSVPKEVLNEMVELAFLNVSNNNKIGWSR